jgi:hypothetical protein
VVALAVFGYINLDTIADRVENEWSYESKLHDSKIVYYFSEPPPAASQPLY